MKKKKKTRKKSALDSMLLRFCFVRVRYIFLRLNLFLFFHCSRAINSIVPLLFSAQMLRLIVLNVFLHKIKCRKKHFGKKLHTPLLYDTFKVKNYEQKNSPDFQEVLLSTISCASCFSWCNTYIYLFLRCAS